MSEDKNEELFAGLNPRVELKADFGVTAEPSGHFAAFKITLELEIDKDTPIPPVQFHPIEGTNFVKVKCYFCQKERVMTHSYYINSTWGLARFKNDERTVVVCSPYCPTLLPEEQRHLFAYDNVRFKSVYTEKGCYTGEYRFNEPPTHDLDFRDDGSVWNRCYFCGKEEVISFQECFYLSWDNLDFPTDETVRVCSQNCIPPSIG